MWMSTQEHGLRIKGQLHCSCIAFRCLHASTSCRWVSPCPVMARVRPRLREELDIGEITTAAMFTSPP